jgi:hypothetical protein
VHASVVLGEEIFSDEVCSRPSRRTSSLGLVRVG